jgi:predicted RNA-binding Zn-ribbon protein involved in translation (DUF1610 family)
MAQKTICPKCGKSRFRMQKEQTMPMDSIASNRRDFTEDGGYTQNIVEVAHFQCLECGHEWNEQA